MNARLIGGGLAAYAYNHGLTHVPAGWMRRAYLRLWLGAWGMETSVQMNCRFLNGRKIHLGARNVVNFGCLFDGRKHSIRTGDDVSIGPEAAILSLGHDPQSPDFADHGGDVLIGHRVWIGFRAVILPGVKIGDGAVVGAGAVVTRDVEAYNIVAGNPARKIGERNRDLKYNLAFDPFLL
jgi:acetyltransferase-like isoleucine patch superfamily enzyme